MSYEQFFYYTQRKYKFLYNSWCI